MVLTLDDFFNLGTELHNYLTQRSEIRLPWTISYFGLELILLSCKYEHGLDFFFDYLEQRTMSYGSYISMSCDELDYYGYFIRHKEMTDDGKYNMYTQIGPGLSSFLTHMFEGDNYHIFTDLLGI